MLHVDTTKLADLNANKSKIVILVKWRYPFFTKLENFEKPNDCALIGIFARQISHKLFDGYEKHFDLLIWFDADYTQVDQAYSDSESIEVKEICEIVGQIVKVVQADKIRLLECEEVMIGLMCKVRAEYSIPGAKPGNLDHLRNKALMKQTCKERNIPTANFAIIDFEQIQSRDKLIGQLESEIGVYPMFKKPIKGFGSGKSSKIYNREELYKWIEEMEGKSKVYLVEECIQKREVWADIILLQNGEWIPHFITSCGDLTIREALDQSHPIPFTGQRFEDCEKEFPGLFEFVDDVVKKLKPLFPHVFCVQGFQLEPGTNKYLFTECGYRLNGARGCSLSYKTSGISQETAFLSTYMNSNYAPKADVIPITTYSVWYISEPGILQSHNELPENSAVKSKVKFDWLVPIKTVLTKGTNFNHFIVSVELQNTDKSEIKTDLKYFLDVWRPDILKCDE